MEKSPYIIVDATRSVGFINFKRSIVNMAMKVDRSRCLSCGGCVSICQFNALTLRNMAIEADDKCTRCGTCVRFCPVGALSLGDL